MNDSVSPLSTPALARLSLQLRITDDAVFDDRLNDGGWRERDPCRDCADKSPAERVQIGRSPWHVLLLNVIGAQIATDATFIHSFAALFAWAPCSQASWGCLLTECRAVSKPAIGSVERLSVNVIPSEPKETPRDGC